MIYLSNSLNSFETDDFKAVFKSEVESLDATQLQLQQALSQSSYVQDSGHRVSVLKVTENTDYIEVSASIFFNGIIMGCSCADDPTPDNEIPEYCERLFIINKQSAQTCILADSS